MVSGLTGVEKIALIVYIQRKFKRIRSFRRAAAIKSSNHIRSFSDKLAEGGIEVHSNLTVQEKLKKLGRFAFDNHNVRNLGVEREHKDLQTVPEVEGESTKLYEGQWNIKTNLPDGYGAMILEDGSFYEGSFSNGKMEGHGRLIHPYGDYYTGNWVDSKANGEGVYMHADDA
jgi:hypothetical protein